MNANGPQSALPARTTIVPTRMPSAIDGTETSALRKFSEPASAFSPTISVMPISPIAPGTSNQNAGRNITCAGARAPRGATRWATGTMTAAPMKPLSVGSRMRSPASCPVQAAKSTTSSQPSDPLGAQLWT